MGSVLRNGVAASAVVVAGSLLFACGGNGGQVVEPPPDGAVVRVTVTQDGSAVAGVSVGLYQVGGTTPLSTTTTASNGEATFGNLNPGPYEVEVTVPTGTELSGSARRTVTATEGSVAGVTFELATLDDGSTVEVLLTNNLTFSPSTRTIQVGQTVIWRNEGAMLHTVTPDGHSEWEEAQLSQAGDTFSHTFDTPGSFPYYCVPHLGVMSGVITVE